MKVLLKKHVKGLGRPGEVKEAAEGYARNYLIPSGAAVPVTRQEMKVVRDQAGKRERLRREAEAAAKRLAAKLAGAAVTIRARADESGTLYAAVGAREVAAALRDQGFEVGSLMIRIDEPLKRTGRHSVVLDLSSHKVGLNLLIEPLK